MEELQLVLTPSRVDQRSQGIRLTNWRVGQTINALVSDRMPSGGVLLNVGSQSFVSSRDIPVQPGARIQLEVQQTEPKLVLRLIGHPSAGGAYPSPDIAINGTPLNYEKTGASGLSYLLKNFAKDLQGTPLSQTSSAAEIRSLLANNFLKPGAINATSIQTALVLSGIFTEALWVSTRPSLGARSTKTILMLIRQRAGLALESSSLTSQERATLSRLVSNIDSSITSITHQQISSLPQDAEKSKWLATLPLELGEELIEIEVEIERRTRRQDDDSSAWSFRFSLSLESLGPITVLVDMQNGRLRIDFRVTALINERLNNSLPVLRDRLIASGIVLDHIGASVFKDESDDKSHLPQVSLDISV